MIKLKPVLRTFCSSLTSVTIPDSVTSIGEDAFSDCRSLESVVIPDSVTSIGYAAFSRCSSLTSVTIGNSVTYIGNGAFENCSNLESVYITDLEAWCNIKFSSSSANPLDHGANLYLNGSLVKDLVIPDSVTSIDNYAFSGCSSLESVVIGDSVNYIYGSAFSGCSSLTNLRVDTNNPNYSSSDDGKILYNKDKTKLIAYPSATGDVAIPDSVTSIGGSAFSDCSKLTSVTFKYTNNWYYTNNSDYTDGTAVDVTDKAQNATYLKSTYYNKYWYKYSETTVTVTADNETDAISKLSTGGNHTVKVTGAITSDTISSIKTALKNNSNAYVNLDLSDTTGLTSIDYHAFLYCSSLTSIVIPDSVTYIGGCAFKGCSSLTSVTIPDSVTYIYGETFYNCDSLTTVNYKGTQEQWEQISIYYGNEDLKSATINYNYTGE